MINITSINNQVLVTQYGSSEKSHVSEFAIPEVIHVLLIKHVGCQ